MKSANRKLKIEGAGRWAQGAESNILPSAFCLLPSRRLRPASCALRPGLTLVEMLVSLVCVLLLMMAYTQLFSDVGSKVGAARSMIELNSRMRSAAQRLRSDLESHTCDMTVWQRPETGSGYFEIIEGPLCDKTPAVSASPLLNNGLTSGAYTAAYPATGGLFNSSNSIEKYPLGDTDDVLMFTIRSKEGPYIGRSSLPGYPTVQSNVAEVVWFLRPTLQSDNKTPVDPPTFTLYRRVFLVLPTWGGGPVSVPLTNITGGLDDISAHLNLATGSYDGNTLSDLTKRECRYAHAYNSTAPFNGFPHKVDPSMLVPFGGKLSTGIYQIDPTIPSYTRYGEDVVLTNVLSFDVQVWDPTVQVKNNSGLAVLPGDPGYAAGTPFTPPVVGGYVDLYNNNALGSGQFVGAGDTKSQLQAANSSPTILQTWIFDDHKDSTTNLPDYGQYSQKPATFDTWSFHYEMDGLDQDDGGSGPVDEGTDQIVGITGGGGSGYETSPPYPYPLRGIRIRIRCYEPDARDVREVTVTESFVPE